MVTRRTYLAVTAGTLASLAGCMDTSTETPDSRSTAQPSSDNTAPNTTTPETETTPVNNWGGNPVTVGLTQQETAPHEIHDRVEAALTYWEENADRYTDQTIEYTYKPNTDAPDIEIITVKSILSCGPHDEDIIVAGCAPVITRQAPSTSEVEIRSDLEGDHLERVLKHEFGHTLGLQHTDEPQHIMSDDVEERIPDFEDRMAAVNAYNDGITLLNQANSYYSTGLERYEREEFYDAINPLERARNTFRDAREQFQIAADTAFRLEEDRAVEVTEDAAETAYEYALSMRYLKDASEAYGNGRYSRGDEYVEQHQEHHRTAQRMTVRSSAVIADELGIPT